MLRLYTASPHGPPDPTFGFQMEGCNCALNVFVSFDRNSPFPMSLCQVEDDLPMVVEEEVLGGGEEIEQERKFTRPRFVQVRFF